MNESQEKLKIVIHLGYPRTGTTLLQDKIFSENDKLNYLGPKSNIKEFKIKISRADLSKLTYLHTFSEIYNDKIDYVEVEKIINKSLFSKEKVNIISCETYLSYKKFYELECYALIYKYLVKNFGNVDLIFLYTIRDQYHLMKSHFFRSFGVLSKFLDVKNFKEFIGNFEKRSSYKTSNFFKFVRIYDFNYVYDSLKFHFPEAKIKILTYEDLNNNLHRFVKILSELLNLEEKILLDLLSTEKKLNQLRIKDKVIYYESKLQTLISPPNSAKKNYIISVLKKLFPNFLKKKINSMLYSRHEVNLVQEAKERKVVANYYKRSNQKFSYKLKKLNN